MIDIVERLLTSAPAHDTMGEAADEIRRLRGERVQFDCRYTMGKVADVSGSHCPADAPCMRCEIERLRAKLKKYEMITGRI